MRLRQTLFLLVLFTATLPAHAGPLQDGLEAFRAGEHARALELWQPLADKGNPDAQYNIALMHANGWGVEADMGKAGEWYQRAAEQGHADAQYNLGLMYVNGQGAFRSDKEALMWWRQAAAQGHPQAQFNLGLMYAYGMGASQDGAAAVQLWEQAALQGSINARSALARVYSEGLFGVAADPEKAATWMGQASADTAAPAADSAPSPAAAGPEASGG